jgi:asparagine synthase (glutamine-hydrolysing)
VEELRRIDATGRRPTVLARALYREVRSRYHELCLDWHDKMSAAHGLERAFPFLDRDLVEFVMGTPGEMLARGGTPKALLRAAVSHVVPASIVERRTKGDFTATVNASSRRQLAGIRELLSRDAMVVQDGYVDADKLERGLRAADAALERSQSSIAAWRVTALVAFEMWLRQFFGNGNSRREEMAWQDGSTVNAR